MRPKTLLAVATACLLASGCDKLTGGGADAGADGSAPAAAETKAGEAKAPELDVDEQRSAKLQPYIKCLNDFSGDIRKSRSRYMEETDAKEGPGKKTRLHANMLKMFTDPEECIKAMRAGVDVSPDEPELEKAGTAFADALAQLQGPMKEGYEYFDKEDFKDDKWQKGKELHPKLMAGFDAFNEADKALHTHVEAINTAVQEKRLAKLEKEQGRKLPFLIENSTMKAKRLVKVSDVPKYQELELEAHQKALEDYSKALAELKTYSEANEEEAGKLSMFSSFLSAGEDYEKSAKALMRRKRDNEKYSRGEIMTINANNAAAVDGSPGQVIDRYNKLIDRANGL